MKNRYKYSIFFLVLFFVPINTYCQCQSPQKEFLPFFLWTLIGLLAGIIIGGSSIYLYSRFKIYSILATEKNKYLDRIKQHNIRNEFIERFFKYVELVRVLKKSKDEKKIDIYKKNEEIGQLRTQIENLKTKKEQREEGIKYQGKNETVRHMFSREKLNEQIINTTSAEAKKTMEFFFTIPENDGSFKTSNARKVKEIDCFYKIEPDKSGQKGRLSYLSGDYDLRALDNIDYYLNPVCEIENIPERTNARNILMTCPGTVIKRGEDWIVDEKNKIKIRLL
jgi:hypothetical protein